MTCVSRSIDPPFFACCYETEQAVSTGTRCRQTGGGYSTAFANDFFPIRGIELEELRKTVTPSHGHNLRVVDRQMHKQQQGLTGVPREPFDVLPDGLVKADEDIAALTEA